MTAKGKILLWSSNIWIFADGLLGPLFVVFAQKIGGDIFEITWAWAVFLITTGIVSIFIGKISDSTISKESLVTLGYALTSLFTFSYLLVSAPLHLLFVQMGLGLALALCSAPWLALYDEHSDDKRDGYIWGLSDGWGRILSGIAMVLGGLIVSIFSFKVLFITMGVLQAISTVYQARIHFKR